MRESQLVSVMEKLERSHLIKMTIEGMAIHMQLWQDGQKVSLRTSIFCGENFIPHRVRNSLKHASIPGIRGFLTSLTVDEKAFEVILTCSGEWTSELEEFRSILTDFIWVAEEWKRFLDQKGREDLLYIYVKK